MKKKRSTIWIALLLCLTFLLPLPVQASAIKRLPGGTDYITGWPKGPRAASESAVLMEADTGIVVYNKRMTEKRYPASTTKIMTALLTIENCSLDEQVTFTQTGINEIYGNNSNIGMQVGEVLTVEQCLYGLMLESANEIATQLAEYVGGGNVQTFVDMMNQKAADLGCTGTHFNNASGLPDENHYTTAYDLALILQACIQNETFVKISGTYQYELAATNMNPNPRPLTNHHPLIQPGQYYYEGVLVGKTGYTDMSKNTLVTAAAKDGLTYVAVTLGSDIGGVINDTTNLFNYGFENFEKIKAEGDDLLVEDGTLLVPVGTARKDLTYESEEEGDYIRRTYRFSKDTYVGTALVQKNEVTNPQKIEVTDLPTPAPASETPDVPPSRAAYIAIAVLAALILLGLLTIILKARRNRRR